MQKAKKKGKFESEVQLGLLAIVFLLIFLNFVSNVVIYRARSVKRDEVMSHLNSSAVAVSRSIQARYPESLTEQELSVLSAAYRLSSLNVVPSRPLDESISGRRQWFSSIARQLPTGQLPELATMLVRSEFRTVTRGEDNEYFYVYPIPAGAGRHLLITSVNDPTLAYLDGSGMLIFVVGLAAMLVVSVGYLLLYRYIFSPFRQIREHAKRAGRQMDENEGEVDSIVADYQRIIDELRENEEKLMKLNKEISHRADSLEQFNDYLLSSIESGMITINNEGQVRSINKAAAEMLILRPDNHEDEPFSSLFEVCPELREFVGQAVHDSRTGEYREIDFSDISGRVLTLGVTISAILDRQNKQIGFSILINDLTELRQLRSELETKHRLAAMGEMAGGLAHQLRNSLGAIAGYGNLVKRKTESTNGPTKTVESLLQEAHEAEKLISQFLDFTKPIQLSPQNVEIVRLIEEIVDSFSVRDKYQRIDFKINAVTNAEVELDPVLFKQALCNLIDNAAGSYEQQEGLIIVGASAEGRNLQVTVRDFGCGIAELEREKVFTPFYSNNPLGTGLGLPLVSKIVDLHFGRIQLESVVGRGTLFTLTFPLDNTVVHQTGREITTG